MILRRKLRIRGECLEKPLTIELSLLMDQEELTLDDIYEDPHEFMREYLKPEALKFTKRNVIVREMVQVRKGKQVITKDGGIALQLTI